MNNLTWFLALKFLRSKKQEKFMSISSAFSFIGIVLGTAILIIVLSIMDGVQSEIIKILTSFNGHITIQGKTSLRYDNIIQDVMRIQYVDNAQMIIERQAVCATKDDITGVVILGLSDDAMKYRMNIAGNVMIGKIIENNPNGILIGRSLAKKLSVHVGETLVVYTPTLHNTIFGSIPKTKTFYVMGIYNTGVSEYDSHYAIISIEMAKKLFNVDVVDGIAIFLKDQSYYTKTCNNLIQTVNNDIKIYGMGRAMGSIGRALTIQRNTFIIILSLIVIIASFNIISNMIMLVQDKRQNIAILRTMGVNKNFIVKIFLIIGVRIGIIGSIFGIIFGVLGALYIDELRIFIEGIFNIELLPKETYMITQLPTKLDLWNIIIVALFAIIISLLAAIYPAWKASKTEPVQVFK